MGNPLFRRNAFSPVFALSLDDRFHRPCHMPGEDRGNGVADLTFGRPDAGCEAEAVGKRLDAGGLAHGYPSWKRIMELDVPVAFGAHRVPRTVCDQMAIALFAADFGFAPDMRKVSVLRMGLQIRQRLLRRDRHGGARSRSNEFRHVAPRSHEDHALARLRHAVFLGVVEMVRNIVAERLEVGEDFLEGCLVLLHEKASHVLRHEHFRAQPRNRFHDGGVEAAALPRKPQHLAVDRNVLAWETADDDVRVGRQFAHAVVDVAFDDVLAEIQPIRLAGVGVDLVSPDNVEGVSLVVLAQKIESASEPQIHPPAAREQRDDGCRVGWAGRFAIRNTRFDRTSFRSVGRT